MQVVILAGGLGTRIQGVAGGRPKSMLQVCGRPFIEYQLNLLVRNGIRDIVLCTGYLGEQIEEHVGNGHAWGVQIDYSREDPTRLLGTGGALVNALPLLQESFLVMYGDSYLPTDFRALIAAFTASSRPAMMSVFQNEEQWDKSNTMIEANRVVYYSKNAQPGETDYIDYGLTAYQRAVMEGYRKHTMPLDLAVILGNLVAQDKLGAFVVSERFYEVGKPEGLAEFEEYVDDRIS